MSGWELPSVGGGDRRLLQNGIEAHSKNQLQ